MLAFDKKISVPMAVIEVGAESFADGLSLKNEATFKNGKAYAKSRQLQPLGGGK